MNYPSIFPGFQNSGLPCNNSGTQILDPKSSNMKILNIDVITKIDELKQTLDDENKALSEDYENIKDIEKLLLNSSSILNNKIEDSSILNKDNVLKDIRSQFDTKVEGISKRKSDIHRAEVNLEKLLTKSLKNGSIVNDLRKYPKRDINYYYNLQKDLIKNSKLYLHKYSISHVKIVPNDQELSNKSNNLNISSNNSSKPTKTCQTKNPKISKEICSDVKNKLQSLIEELEKNVVSNSELILYIYEAIKSKDAVC